MLGRDHMLRLRVEKALSRYGLTREMAYHLVLLEWLIQKGRVSC